MHTARGINSPGGVPQSQPGSGTPVWIPLNLGLGYPHLGLEYHPQKGRDLQQETGVNTPLK